MSSLVGAEGALAIEDAQLIKKACLGWGTDETAIISVLGHRNIAQKKLVRQAYQQLYQEDLITQLKSELSGHFQKAICYWILDEADRAAVLAHTALHKLVPDYRVILEIACVSSPEELLAVKRAYHSRYKCSFEEDVASSYPKSHIVKQFLVAVVSSFRYDGDEVNERLAYAEANVIHEETEMVPWRYEEILRITSTRSKPQLMATFSHYKNNHAKSITKALSRASDDDPSNGLLGMVRIAIRCIKNPEKYYAKVLRNAINGIGTDEDALSRVIVTRAEKDLKEIKELFFKRNGASLEQAVADDTSGDYKAFLLALLGLARQDQ